MKFLIDINNFIQILCVLYILKIMKFDFIMKYQNLSFVNDFNMNNNQNFIEKKSFLFIL